MIPDFLIPAAALGELAALQHGHGGGHHEHAVENGLQRALAGLRGVEPPREFSDQLHEAFTRRVLQSSSWLAVFQITDVFGMTARFNTPGSVSPNNWSHRLPQTVQELDEDPVLLQQAEMFARVAKESGRMG